MASVGDSGSSYFDYWGKAKADVSATARFHLLPFHSLDVAAVGWYLLGPKTKLCRRLSGQLDVSPQWLQRFFCFCLTLHDLGKFARGFQNLFSSPLSHLVSYDGQCVYQERHDTLGFLLWRGHLVKQLSDVLPAGRKLEPWMEVVCGHHGQPPKRKIGWLGSHFLAEDELAAEEFVRDAVALVGPDFVLVEDIDRNRFRQVSWQLAGIAVICDWLGSDQRFFPYCSKPIPLAEYWTSNARPQAIEVLDQASLSPTPVNTFQSIREQFPAIEQPTPLQDFATSITLAEGPQLFLLEDVTGSGKTEAAMAICSRLMSQGLAAGVYVGLPTMATANGMYGRLATSYRQLYAPNTQPSLVLAHGARDLSDQFVESVALSAQVSDRDYGDDELSASAYCNSWLSDNRKKALLADVGIGTVDQALLAVLPGRHQSLRLIGLSDKVLLVDEVHAYDSYMRRLLTALLEVHARQGGSVILLSATVPQNLRQELVAAFAKGIGAEPPELSQQGYPLVTQYSGEGLAEEEVKTRETVKRWVPAARLDSLTSAVAQVERSVSEGRCVCWIRNTVADAREAYELLKHQPWMTEDSLTLFHSRFAMVDRQVIEGNILSRFGPNSSDSDRKGQVLIATQVVEQSLDLDFDGMITDLAPIDLLIQRAGRLQRHNRDLCGRVNDHVVDSRSLPCLYIIGPDVDQVKDENWLESLLPGTQAVYSNVGQLWLTLRAVLKNDGFSMPEDARDLIESVYGEQAQDQIPKPLLHLSVRAEGVAKGDRGMANLNLLDLGKGYSRNSASSSGGWAEDVRVPTRLSVSSVNVVLAKVDGNELRPYATADRHQWSLSQLSLPEHQWRQVKGLIPDCWLEVIDALKQSEPALRWLEVLPLTGVLVDYYCKKDGWSWTDRN